MIRYETGRSSGRRDDLDAIGASGPADMIPCAVGAGQRLSVRRPGEVARAARGAVAPVLEVFLWTRLAIWATVVFAWLWFEPRAHPGVAAWDDPALTRDLGYLTDVWARWDSVWLLRIAEHGYQSASAGAAAFFPLYPASVGLLGRVFGGHYVAAGLVVSLACSLAAFALLHRLAELKLGESAARRAVLYLAVFPMTLFLQAVYSESLFLLLCVAAFLLAERRRWLLVGIVVGLALLTRLWGVALIPSLVLMAWRTPGRMRALAGLLPAPLFFAAYPLWLEAKTGDAFAFVHAQELWHRQISHAGPFGGLWDGLRAGWAGVRQLATGSRTHAYWGGAPDADPLHAAAVNLECLAFLALFIVLAVIAWRRLGAAYGLFAAVSIAIPLSVPSSRWPLLSLPRFGLVIFPLFLALAIVGQRPRLHTAIVTVSALLLGVVAVQWALWQWVA